MSVSSPSDFPLHKSFSPPLLLTDIKNESVLKRILKYFPPGTYFYEIHNSWSWKLSTGRKLLVPLLLSLEFLGAFSSTDQTLLGNPGGISGGKSPKMFGFLMPFRTLASKKLPQIKLQHLTNSWYIKSTLYRKFLNWNNIFQKIK